MGGALAALCVPGSTTLGALACATQTLGPTSALHDETQLNTSTLQSYEDAREFAAGVIEQARAQGGPQSSVLEVTHIQGRKFSPYLKAALIEIHAAGIEIQGTLVTEEEFDQTQREFSENHSRAATQAMSMLVSLPAAQRSSLKTWLSPGHWGAKLAELKNRLFGTPEGLTFFRHFAKRKPPRPGEQHARWGRAISTDVWDHDSPEQYRAAIKNERRMRWLTLESVLSGTAITAVGFMAAGKLPTEIILPLVVNAAWTGLTTYYVRELSSLKSQGHDFSVHPEEEAGNQVRIEPSRRLYTTMSLAQSMFVNSLMLLAVFDPAQNPLPIIGTAVANTIFSVFARIHIEYMIAQAYNGSQRALAAGQPQDSQAQSVRAVLMNRIFGYVYVLLKAVHLLKDQDGAGAAGAGLWQRLGSYGGNVLPLLGVGGFLLELKRVAPKVVSQIRSWGQKPACSALLMLRP